MRDIVRCQKNRHRTDNNYIEKQKTGCVKIDDRYSNRYADTLADGLTDTRIDMKGTQINGDSNPMDGGAWWAAVHGVAKSRTRLSDFTLTFHFHALEAEMATHSSALA